MNFVRPTWSTNKGGDAFQEDIHAEEDSLEEKAAAKARRHITACVVHRTQIVQKTVSRFTSKAKEKAKVKEKGKKETTSKEGTPL